MNITGTSCKQENNLSAFFFLIRDCPTITPCFLFDTFLSSGCPETPPLPSQWAGTCDLVFIPHDFSFLHKHMVFKHASPACLPSFDPNKRSIILPLLFVLVKVFELISQSGSRWDLSSLPTVKSCRSVSPSRTFMQTCTRFNGHQVSSAYCPLFSDVCLCSLMQQ